MKKLITTVMALLIGLLPLQAAVKTTVEVKPAIAQANNPTISGAPVSRDSLGITGVGESFEGSSFMPRFWTVVNVDGGGSNWSLFTATAAMPAHTGTKTAYHSYGVAGYAETGLLITPRLAISANASETSLRFWESDFYPTDYSYHGVMISETDDLPGSFVELQPMPAAPAGPDWRESTIDLSAYKGKNIYLAFKYSGTYADGWHVDDVKVSGATVIPPVDNTAPVAGIPTGTAVATGTAMVIKTEVADLSGVASVVGHYKLTGQTTWNDFVMTASDSSSIFTGTIPAQSSTVIGKLKFTSTDLATPSNTGDSPEFDINWYDPAVSNWVGNIDAINTVSLGLMPGTPWKAGLALDFGTASKKITKIAYICSYPTNTLTWSVLDMADSETWTENVLVAGGLLAETPNTDNVWNVVDVNSQTSVTGTVGIVIDLPTGGYLGRHKEGVKQNSFLNENGVWGKLGEGVYEIAPGDWTIKCFVESMTGIEEEAEILPGKSELNQNYPNPFNPTTTISFYNNMSGKVKLTILNAKGEIVSTLINNSLAAGNHRADFNGAGLNSGGYFYKLETPTATITKKMLLIK